MNKENRVMNRAMTEQQGKRQDDEPFMLPSSNPSLATASMMPEPQLPTLDESQSTTDRRSLIADYRKILNKTEEHRKLLLSDHSAVNLLDDLETANALFGKVRTTQDAALDSKALLSFAELQSQKVQKLKIDSGAFDMDEFMRRTIAKMTVDGRTDLNWLALASNALKATSHVTIHGFLYIKKTIFTVTSNLISSIIQ